MGLIKCAKIITYSALRTKLKRPYGEVVLYMARTKSKVWEMEFPHGITPNPYGKITSQFDPKSKVAILFEGGSNCCGLKSLKWYVIVGNRLFERLNYRDVGIKGKMSGLKTIRDGKAIIYLRPMKINKEDKIKIETSIAQKILMEKQNA